MKRSIAIAMMVFGAVAHGQMDRTNAPEPAAAKALEIADPVTFKLDNGLQVILVENHKVPRVSFQVSADRDPVVEGDKSGMLQLMGEVWMKGTSTLSKDEINQKVDFMGSSLNFGSTGFFGSVIKRNADDFLKVASDILLNPTFPEKEFEKAKTQAIQGLSFETSNPDSKASRVAGVVNFGKDHPYGEVVTEASLKAIELDDLKNYYNSYIKPNISYLVIVGDANEEEARKWAQQYFGAWKTGNVPSHAYEQPSRPAGRQVTFVPHTNAVQSVIRVTYTVDLKPNDPEALKVSVLNGILGGGTFSGRLMQNLREDKAWTYGCRSSIGSDELTATFTASGSFRNEVTDSAVYEILSEMEKIFEQPVTEKELSTTVNSMNGIFALSLERPQTIARFALNTMKYNLPADHYKTYQSRLKAITVQDLQKIAKKYFNPANVNIVVVGSKDIADKLARFDSDGSLTMLDENGDPVKDIEPAPEGMTAEDVLRSHCYAVMQTKEDKVIAKRLKKMKSLKTVYEAEVQGMKISIENYATKKNETAMLVKMGPMVMQKQYFDGSNGGSSGQGGSKEMTPEEIAAAQARNPFLDEWISGEDNSRTLEGVREVDGMRCYQVRVAGDENDSYEYYSVETGLKYMVQSTSMGPMGKPSETKLYFKDYKDHGGMLIPEMIVNDMGMFKMEGKMKEVGLNEKLDSELFSGEG